MGSRERSARAGPRREADRYREAAELALEQLDWCINYLYRINKPNVARVLENNRRTIRQRYRL
jgi:hypothetical protein